MGERRLMLEPPPKNEPEIFRAVWDASGPGRAWHWDQWAKSIKANDPRYRLAQSVRERVAEITRCYRKGADSYANMLVERLDAARGQAAFVAANAKLRKIHEGYRNRRDAKDRSEVRDLATAHWRKFSDDPVAAVIRSSAIAPFARYYSDRTVRDWIKDLKPGGTRAGRPKKK